MNWTPGNIFDARDMGQVLAWDGFPMRVELNEHGWTIGASEGLDVFSACALLNHWRCEIPAEIRARGEYSR